jgi:hypothetical protein
MLSLFVLLALICGCGLIIGHALLTRLDPWACFDRKGDRALISIWIGVLVLANFLLIISLFVSLSFPVTIPATLLLLGLSIWPLQSRISLRQLVCTPAAGAFLGIAGLALGIAAYCSQVIVWYDSGLYHLQVIKWLSEFGVVPGLGLIHSRFGFVSSWFTLPALFNQGVLQGRVASLPGALCLLLLLVQGLDAFLRIIRQNGRIPDFFMAAASFLMVPVILIWALPNSPSPDFPVIVLGVVVAWVMLGISSHQGSHDRADRILHVTLAPLILATGAVSIKLSALPLMVVAGFFFIFSGRISLKKIFAAIILVTFSLAPVAAAGIMTTGCAFYPVSFLCVDLPWSLGAAMAESESRIIREWAMGGGMLPPENAAFWEWIVPWFQAEKVCTAFIFLTILAIIILVSSRTRTTLWQSRYIMAIGISGSAFMFFGAPTWRFGLGYLVVLPALAVANHANSRTVLREKPKEKQWVGSFGLIGITAAVIIAFHVHVMPRPSYRLLDEALAAKLVASDDNPHFNWLLPPRIWSIAYEADEVTGRIMALENIIVVDNTSNIVYYRPERSDTCWDNPLPCAPTKLEKISLRHQDRGIAGGFEKNYPASMPIE